MVESIAAAVLVAGGAIALVLAGRARLAGGSVALLSEPPVSHSSSRAAVYAPLAGIVATLSLAAAVIHFAAAPAHLEDLGLLGLGFVVAGTFQSAWALAWLIEPTRAVVGLGLAGNLAIVAAWTWSRSVGLPGLPAEGIAGPDAAATLFEAAIVAFLVARSRVRPAGPAAMIVVVPAVGIVFLITTLALSSPALGHGH
jgi:hypothetical protein